jgi:hypothetical protein
MPLHDHDMQGKMLMPANFCNLSLRRNLRVSRRRVGFHSDCRRNTRTTGTVMPACQAYWPGRKSCQGAGGWRPSLQGVPRAQRAAARYRLSTVTTATVRQP